MNHVCFLDLDGVCVDFVAGALRHHGKTLAYEDTRWDFPSQIGFAGVDAAAFWDSLGRQFWANLDWTPDGWRILRDVERHFGKNVVLLSSPCATDGCVDGKMDWIKKHLPEYRRRFFIGPAKHLLAGPGKLLVDDHDANVDAFVDAGGEAVLVPRPWNRTRGTGARWCFKGKP